MLKNLSQVTRAPRDATAKHKLLCKDGWYWDYGLKAWVQNSIDARLWRVAGKTRAQLDDRELVPDDLRELIATFWAEVGRYEQAGGKNINDDDEHIFGYQQPINDLVAATEVPVSSTAPARLACPAAATLIHVDVCKYNELLQAP